MEKLSLPLLLLSLVPLVPLVFGAELQNSEILEQVDLVKVEQPQSCPSDLQSLLKDLSIKLAVLETKVETLQKENSDQALELDRNQALIQELRIINAGQSSKLTEFKTQLDSQHQEQSTKLTEFQSQVDSQQREMKSRLNETEKEVEFLMKDREDLRVVFSASLLASGAGNIGPYNVDTTLVFRQVFTNIGQAYSSHTGIFRAPRRGLYSFDFFFNGQGSTAAFVKLMKNTDFIVCSYEFESSGHASAGNTVNLQLNPGDVVFLQLGAHHRIFDSENHYCTFSGRLLFTL